MGNVPDSQEAVARFNQGRDAFLRALEAVKEQDLARYERESRAAWTEVVGALEWGVKYCLDAFCPDRLPPEKLDKLNEEGFEKLLRMLARHARPRFERERAAALHRWRIRRNTTTHEGALLPHRQLREAFFDIRRFLLDYLPVSEGQVPPLPRPPSTTEDPAEKSSVDPSPGIRRHRVEGGAAFIERLLHEGLERLRYSRRDDQGASLASFEREALDLLTWHARRLLDAGLDADGRLEGPGERVEETFKDILMRSMDHGVSPRDTERLLMLMPLLHRQSMLCIEAGWLRRDEDGLGFEVPTLAALLVGRQLARGRGEAERLTEQVGRERSWAEAAWMAVADGDDLASWARPLLAERDPLRLFERVVVTCAAFGATPEGAVPSEEMARAFQLCVAAMVAFAPRYVSDEHVSDPDSPWFLPEESWRQCVLDLAQASRVLGARLSLVLPPTPPAPLSEVLTALELPFRLVPEEREAIATLCAPDAAARSGRLGEPFLRQVFGFPETRLGRLMTEPFLETWFLAVGIPILRRVGGSEARRLLVIPEGRHPAGYLLNRASLIPSWFEDWRSLSVSSPEEAVQAWVGAVPRLVGLAEVSEALRRLVLEQGLERLDSLGLRETAVQALLENLVDLWPRTDRDGERIRTHAAVLRLLGFGDPEWQAHSEMWMEQPALGWRTLLEAGVPQALIAQWCVRKLIQKREAPEAFRHGPVGVIAISGAEVLGSGQWQRAFQQAEEALNWLLAEGDASALSVLADACLAPDALHAGFAPSMGQVAGMEIPLHLVFWRKVLARAAGREALYARVERNAPLGEFHWLSDLPLPLPSEEVALWERLVSEAWKTPWEDEAWRLLTCFEQRMSVFLVTERNWPSLKAHIELQGEPEPTVFPFYVRLPGQPWENPWAPLHVKARVLAYAAEHGEDVVEPVRIVGGLLAAAPAPEAVRAAPFFGDALRRSAEHHPARAEGLLRLALSPEWLRPMRGDSTASFWVALLSAHGSACVFGALARTEGGALGLGCVDALLAQDLPALRERELSPELLRPILVRASEGAYSPSDAFWREAWTRARAVEEFPELPRLPAGVWLEQLLDKSRHWEARARRSLVGHLARYSLHEEVRGRCLEVLLQEPERLPVAP
ncbi:hypothetical protein HPC49_02755 [Pyxidicoccus fallax]|uniref:Uncharacterized protein n=1 Tax=Pyxidicoccus fallax TaxID=394095 RepID=A0A848L3R1_9BACT|nr:hypothetical protein [Pyxidicoccus fallax]NMO13269.1 hypothetical protein [Pyxidicoccus fallax]NPC77175.1 hypothetical protein [Pyxidicoccus fallax]